MYEKIVFWTESLNMHTSCMFEEVGELQGKTISLRSIGLRN